MATSPTGEPGADDPDSADAAGFATGGACYQQWGWPVTVHRDQVRLTGVLLLPPTVTPRGPITWTRPPREDSLRLCREIDLFGALRTALNDASARRPPPGGDSLVGAARELDATDVSSYWGRRW